MTIERFHHVVGDAYGHVALKTKRITSVKKNRRYGISRESMMLMKNIMMPAKQVPK